METFVKICGYILIAILIALLIILAFIVGGWITMWAWNLVMPVLFHLQTINLMQGIAIDVLISTIRGLLSVTVNKKG
jgi:hypothetical protein